jgi:hypothetical protein
MPEPSSASSDRPIGSVSLQDAPGGDQDWDSLFPNPELSASQPQAANPGTNPQQPQTPPPPFLKAGDTVYNTAEDAATGVAHKDSVIAKYRNFLASNGLDPNAVLKDDFRPQAQPQAQPQPQASTSPYKHYQNPNFFDEVAAAATSKDKARYTQLLGEFTQEAIQATLDPWRATLAETSRNRAIRQASTEVPDFQKFIDGPGYKKVVDSFPLYKEMVQIGENDPVAAQRLPEVYKSMYLIYQGMNQNQTQPVQATNAPPNTPTVRQQPTLQPSSLTPPPPSSGTQGWQESNWNRNKTGLNEARKSLIQDGDNRFKGMRFEDMGL